MIINLGNTNSVLNQFIAELRDSDVQQDSMRFRKNLERIGEIFAFEISKTLKYTAVEVSTTLGLKKIMVPDQQIVLASIMRSGLPFHTGMLAMFDKAENSFISVYRKFEKKEKPTIQVDYISSADLNDKVLILADTIIATGSSTIAAYKELMNYGKPVQTHIVTTLTSMEGLENLKSSFSKKKVTIWLGAVDDELTAESFVVPGLGDAGDLAFGNKLPSH